jgi:glucokinase
MTILLCDVGGTHIRFAVSELTGAMSQPEKMRVDSHRSLEDAISRYLLAQSLSADSITHLYLAFSNRNSWSTEEAMLKTVLPKAAIMQVNDFEANALGILVSDQSEVHTLFAGDGKICPRASRVVLGVGTGLGLAYLFNAGGRSFIQRTHGGHMLPAVIRPEHLEIFQAISEEKDDGTILIYEDVISGKGLFSLYTYICQRNQLNPEYHDASDLLIAGKDDPVVLQALNIFFELLGIFTHQAVAFGHSYGGVYLTGGVIDRLLGAGLFNTEAFLKGFHQKNVPVVVQDVMATPIYWVRDEFVSLRGLLRHALDERGHIDA